MVAAGEAFDTSPANIESRVVRSTLPDGMKMSLLSRKTRGGTVVASVTMRFGDEKSLFGKAATASITGGLLMRGTKNKSRQQIQDEMDRLKAHSQRLRRRHFSATASIETMEANLPGALRLAAEILREPAFPDSEFETVRTTAHRRRRGRPQRTASARLHRLQPPPRHLSPRRPALCLHPRRADRGPQEGHARRGPQVLPGVLRRLRGRDRRVRTVRRAGRFPSWPPSSSAIGRAPGSYVARRPRCTRSRAARTSKIETPDKQNAFFVAGQLVKTQR